MSIYRNKRDIIVLALSLCFLLVAIGAVNQGGRERAKRVVCATHIKHNLQVLLAYAADYNGDLPSIDIGGWLQDFDYDTASIMLDYGATQETFYCPSNTAHMQFMNYFWLFGATNNSGDPNDWDRYWDGQEFKDLPSRSYMVAGYFFLLAGRDAYIRRYITDTEEKEWLDSVYMSDASHRELITDNIMGEDDEDARWGYNFGQITSGGMMSHDIVERSSHLISDEEPAGGNIGFLDGHVSWRKWDPPTYPMVVNGKAVPRWNASGPASWW